MIIGGAKHAEKIISEEAKKELEFITDMAKELEALFSGRGVKNNQIEGIIKIFTNRHTERILNMRLDDEINAMREYEYKPQPIEPAEQVPAGPRPPQAA